MRSHGRRFSALLLLALPAALLFGFCTLAPVREAHAQKLRFVSHRCDWNLAAKRWDGGITLRRYQWSFARAGATWLTSEASHAVFRMPRSFTAPGSMVAIDLVPHIRGAALRSYPVDLRDWAADLTTGSAPTFIEYGRRSRLAAIAGATIFAGLWMATACYASP